MPSCITCKQWLNRTGHLRILRFALSNHSPFRISSKYLHLLILPQKEQLYTYKYILKATVNLVREWTTGCQYCRHKHRYTISPSPLSKSKSNPKPLFFYPYFLAQIPASKFKFSVLVQRYASFVVAL